MNKKLFLDPRFLGDDNGWKSFSAKLQMTAQKIYFCGEAASYNILEQDVILDPRFLEDDNG